MGTKTVTQRPGQVSAVWSGMAGGGDTGLGLTGGAGDSVACRTAARKRLSATHQSSPPARLSPMAAGARCCGLALRLAGSVAPLGAGRVHVVARGIRTRVPEALARGGRWHARHERASLGAHSPHDEGGRFVSAVMVISMSYPMVRIPSIYVLSSLHAGGAAVAPPDGVRELK